MLTLVYCVFLIKSVKQISPNYTDLTKKFLSHVNLGRNSKIPDRLIKGVFTPSDNEQMYKDVAKKEQIRLKMRCIPIFKQNRFREETLSPTLETQYEQHTEFFYQHISKSGVVYDQCKYTLTQTKPCELSRFDFDKYAIAFFNQM